MNEALPPLPVTVVSGYLGAGKTSLVNHLLRNAGGRRILVMVNDFGALNIDADLIESRDGEQITLSNGCACCTMGTELLYALADALDRRPRPDWLVIEASGVADPAKIAAAAHAEPEMRYQGVVTMADAASLSERLSDPLVGAQAAQQVRVADLVLVTKTDLSPFAPAREALAALSRAPVLEAPRGAVDLDLLIDRPEGAPPPTAPGGRDHAALYRSVSLEGGRVSEAGLRALLADPPKGLYRFKGFVETETGGFEAQLVGRTYELRRLPAAKTRIVAIGPAGRFDPEAFRAFWAGIGIG